jgi:hypothetical protein
MILMNDKSLGLREKARQGMQSGKLPTRRPNVMWGGLGNGARCAVCDTCLSADEVEFEFEVKPEEATDEGSSYSMHVPCYAAWESEVSVGFERVACSQATIPPPGADVAHEPQASAGRSR